jgi:hypothetical protein
MSLDHPPEVLRTELHLLEPVLDRDLRGDLAQVDQVLPFRRPLLLGPKGETGLEEDPSVWVIDDVAQDRALVPDVPGLSPLGVQDVVGVREDEQLPVHAHVAEADPAQGDPHRSEIPVRNAGQIFRSSGRTSLEKSL